MRVFANDCSFNYSWEEVSTANWRKYCPWNDKSTHVIAVDTLSRTIDPKSGILRTERLITCKQTAPKWMSTLMGGSDTSLVFEISYVDPASKKVTMTSSNMTFSNIINVRETVVYKPLSETKTQFVQQAKITAVCGGWQKIKNAVEEASVSAFSKNAKTGKEGFESVLEMSRRVFQEEKQEKAQTSQNQQKMMA